MFKAVLFDLDNTLADILKLKEECIRAAVKVMKRNGLRVRQGEAEEKLFGLYERRGLEYQTVFQEFLAEEGVEEPRVLAAGIVAYRRAKAGRLKTYQGVRKVLSALKKKGLLLGVVSDAPRLQAWTRLVALGLQDFFDVVVTFEDTGKTKPHGLPFRTALKKLGLPESEVLFVGDSMERDVLGAKKIGMRAALAEYGRHESRFLKRKRVRGVCPDFTLKKFWDLLAIV